MVEEYVVDASVLVASFLEDDQWHRRASELVAGLDKGDFIFHLPLLALVETLAAINRQTFSDPSRKVYVLRALASFNQWHTNKRIQFYDLNQDRSSAATRVALRDRLRGADAICASLSEELQVQLKSFDREHLQRFQGNVSS